MSITAKNLIPARYAQSSANTEYTSPAGTKTIIDKFSVTNTDTVSRTITVNLVPSGGSVGGSNTITSALTIAAGVTQDLTEMKNQILEAADFISVQASVSSKLVIRASGRQVV